MTDPNKPTLNVQVTRLGKQTIWHEAIQVTNTEAILTVWITPTATVNYTIRNLDSWSVTNKPKGY